MSAPMSLPKKTNKAFFGDFIVLDQFPHPHFPLLEITWSALTDY